MNIIPSIDLMNGQIVRLTKGDKTLITSYCINSIDYISELIKYSKSFE